MGEGGRGRKLCVACSVEAFLPSPGMLIRTAGWDGTGLGHGNVQAPITQMPNTPWLGYVTHLFACHLGGVGIDSSLDDAKLPNPWWQEKRGSMC